MYCGIIEKSYFLWGGVRLSQPLTGPLYQPRMVVMIVKQHMDWEMEGETDTLRENRLEAI
jgi:hypothetical protein